MGYRLSANVEILFTEAGDIPDRIRAAAAAGFDAVEFWNTLDRDVHAIRRAADESGVEITSVVAEPRTNLTFPWSTFDEYFDGMAKGVENAHVLGCPAWSSRLEQDSVARSGPGSSTGSQRSSVTQSSGRPNRTSSSSWNRSTPGWITRAPL